MIDGNGWKPCSADPPGPEAGKLIAKERPRLTIDSSHLRPGLIVGDPHTAKDRQSREVASILFHGRAVMIPGRGKITNHRGELVLKYHPKLKLPRPGAYQFWQSWGISTKIGSELKSYYTELRACTVLNSGHTGMAALEDATGRLADILGIAPLRRHRTSTSLNANLSRSEIVKVRFRPGRPATPCVVVSPDDFNALPLNAAVVLQCIPYRTSHEDRMTVLPIGPAGVVDGLEGAWSIAIHEVRGIAMADRFIEPMQPALRLDSSDPARFRDLEKYLEFYYA
jgi:hypothetical protein